MGTDHQTGRPAEHRRRIRNIDWMKVRDIADSLPGETLYVGYMDQSTRTHIKQGRIAYIDPTKYDVWTANGDAQKKKAHLFMRRK